MDKDKIKELLTMAQNFQNKMREVLGNLPIDLEQTLDNVKDYIKQKGGEK